MTKDEIKLRLQKHVGRVVDGVTYYKYVVVIPNHIIKDRKFGRRKYLKVRLR